MIALALAYLMPAVALIYLSFTGDKVIAQMMEITAREGSHPQRIAMTLRIKARQKWIDRFALVLVLTGLYHVALRGGLI